MASPSSPRIPRRLRERRYLKHWLFRGLIFIIIVWIEGCASAPSTPPPSPKMLPPRPPEAGHLSAAIQTYMGAPYCYGGASPKGVDCSGLIMRVYEKVGIKLPHSSEQQFQIGQAISNPKDLRYGDVLFFNKFCNRRYYHQTASILSGAFSSDDASKPCHAGIYIGNGRFVHSSTTQGVAISTLHQDAWKRSLIGARRYLQPDQ